MTSDREKVIREFEYEVKKTHDEELDFVYLNPNFADKLLALLKDDETRIQYLKDHIAMCKEEVERLHKEQEAIKPKKVKGYNPPMYTIYEYECEKCKSPMMNKQPFCMGCGRTVKWE